MDKQYTPGPWFVGKVNVKKQRVEISTKVNDPRMTYARWDGLARLYGDEDDPVVGTVVMKANARLVAAAPEMFESVCELLDLITDAIYSGDWKVDGAGDPDAALCRTRCLIRKVLRE